MPGLRGVGVVVVALLLDFLHGSGSLPVPLEEDFVQQAALQHQRRRGSGYGMPLRRSGEPSVDWVEWGYDYVMFKLFNSYIRQNLPSASSHLNKQHTTNQHTTSQATSTNNFITARGYITKVASVILLTGCDIQVVNQIDTKFRCNICKQDIVYTSVQSNKGTFVNYKSYKFSCASM
jgi:hypothetical protein